MKNRWLAPILVGAFGLGVVIGDTDANAALLYCSQPYAPSTYLSKPTKPFCIASRRCSEWEVRNYQNEVDRYFNDLRRYASEVDNYYEDAARYISCMSDLD